MSNPGVTTQVMQWVETRLPIFSFINHSVGTEYPTPRNLNYWWSLGSIAGVALVLQIVTGIVLAMHYVPHADMAFDSVEHIMRDVNYGWMLRYMHANGASLFFVAVYIHMFRGLYFGSYKAPRELLWWFGILIFLAMMATAFMGYVLPWGQMSFWGATVITNMFTAIPVVGEAVTTWLWGGYSVAGPTLQRFFSLHYLLPFVIFALMFLHLWALHTSKSNNPLGIDVKSEKDTLPFHPYFTTKDLVGFGVFFVILAYWVFFNPNYMGHPDNYIPANPLVTPPHIVPEWYFLPFYAILRAVPDKLGGVVLMLGAILILFVIPWLDTSRVRSATFRPVYKGFFWIFVVNGLVLGWIGANPPEGAYIIIGRIATAYYFAHFILVMPIVGWFEKPKPLPDSIAAAVLGDDSAKEAN
ncbi:MAG: cytochrome b [Alphaproteobacteria bacterium]|jgi:ubiquinol-cytochrome c reductase cytochrome b/c1 subunit|nr:cytochrome b [Alphaproteobacteria bacterium]MBT4083229.1 cytochrome b [Alphaproteobacteria bacterium]MBT4544275.1 cytochrome b [Alphaproteobacteria bacterium]MBT7743832.1 cytochrome b [Alphaproteobacteria bacterium]